jgi:hypothetical protein
VFTVYIKLKKIGGLTIIDSWKEKLSVAEFYHRLDGVDKEWGNKYLRVENNDVLVLGDNN